MKVHREKQVNDPGYPDAKEFLKNRATLGAAILGAGMALGSCAEPVRTAGVPIRSQDEVSSPNHARKDRSDDPLPWTKSDKKQADQSVRLLGKPKIEPKDNRLPLPGVPPAPRLGE